MVIDDHSICFNISLDGILSFITIILILDKIAKGHFIVPLTWHTAYSGKKTY